MDMFKVRPYDISINVVGDNAVDAVKRALYLLGRLGFEYDPESCAEVRDSRACPPDESDSGSPVHISYKEVGSELKK